MRCECNRREFLRIGSVAITAAALGTFSTTAGDTPKKRSLKKAIMYATIGYKGSVMEKFDAVKAAGFSGVEPMSHMKQEEVLKALDATGLQAASVCCDTHWSKPLSHPDPAKRQEGLEGLLVALKDAKRYGASSVLLVPGVVNKDVNYDQCFERSVAEIRKAIPLAKDLDVKIAVENVWNNFITKPEQAKAFLDAINSDYVGWHFDIGNVLRFGAPETWIATLSPRILKLHIKEYSAAKRFDVRFFEGDNDWPTIMKALDTAGYKGWAISEQPGAQASDAKALKDLSDRMERILAS